MEVQFKPIITPKRIYLGIIITLLILPILVVIALTVSIADSFTFAESVALGKVVQISDSFTFTEFISLASQTISRSVTTITQTITTWLTITSNTIQGNPFIITDTSFDAIVSQVLFPIATLIFILVAAVYSDVKEFSLILGITVFTVLALARVGIYPSWVPLIIILIAAGSVVKVVAEAFK